MSIFMGVFLVTVSYRLDGKIESLARIERGENYGCDDARAWWQEARCQSDPGTELHCTPEEVSAASLRESYPEREELICAVARYCALVAVEAGAPPIPEGETFSVWSDQCDAFAGDYDFYQEVVEEEQQGDRELFREAYLKNLFGASPCGPAKEE